MNRHVPVYGYAVMQVADSAKQYQHVWHSDGTHEYEDDNANESMYSGEADNHDRPYASAPTMMILCQS